MQKFTDQKEFSTRGNLVVSRNENNNKIVDVRLVDSENVEGLQALFQEKGNNKQYYQLSVPELNLMTSMNSNYYQNSLGLNDTITFNLDSET